jgi:hypothetical protein
MHKEIFIATTTVIAIFFGLFKLEIESCLVKGQSFDDVNYSFLGGCMVKHKGKWLPLDNIRGFDDK